MLILRKQRALFLLATVALELYALLRRKTTFDRRTNSSKSAAAGLFCSAETIDFCCESRQILAARLVVPTLVRRHIDERLSTSFRLLHKPSILVRVQGQYKSWTTAASHNHRPLTREYPSVDQRVSGYVG